MRDLRWPNYIHAVLALVMSALALALRVSLLCAREAVVRDIFLLCAREAVVRDLRWLGDLNRVLRWLNFSQVVHQIVHVYSCH